MVSNVTDTGAESKNLLMGLQPTCLLSVAVCLTPPCTVIAVATIGIIMSACATLGIVTTLPLWVIPSIPLLFFSVIGIAVALVLTPCLIHVCIAVRFRLAASHAIVVLWQNWSILLSGNACIIS